MIETLNIDIIAPKEANIPNGAPILTIDTQANFTNNSLPAHTHVIGVIDHHLSDSDCEAPFLDIRPDFGATASIIAQYFRDGAVDMHRRTATALAFGMASETRDMERVKRQIEVDLYTWVLPLADHLILGCLRNPKIECDYVCTLSGALNTAYLYASKYLVCHMPELPRTDDLGRIADFFDQMEVVKWVLCTENKGDSYLIPHISRVLSGASVANVKRRCIRILQVQTFAADAPLRTRPQGKPPLFKSFLHTANFGSP